MPGQLLSGGSLLVVCRIKVREPSRLLRDPVCLKVDQNLGSCFALKDRPQVLERNIFRSEGVDEEKRRRVADVIQNLWKRIDKRGVNVLVDDIRNELFGCGLETLEEPRRRFYVDAAQIDRLRNCPKFASQSSDQQWRTIFGG